jgi:antitoxin Phd
MVRRCSVAEARNGLAKLVHDVEGGRTIAITRRGRPIAVMLSIVEYERFMGEKRGFWDDYQAFLKGKHKPDLSRELDTFDELRDLSAGREVAL